MPRPRSSNLGPPMTVKFHKATCTDIRDVTEEIGADSEQDVIRRACKIGLVLLRSHVLDFLPTKPARR